MVATAGSSRPSAIFCGTKERSPGQLQRVIAQDVVLNSHERLQETGTWHMRNASHDVRQIQADKR
jgi:hypothetical protein